MRSKVIYPELPILAPILAVICGILMALGAIALVNIEQRRETKKTSNVQRPTSNVQHSDAATGLWPVCP